jgi:hypothetical protein
LQEQRLVEAFKRIEKSKIILKFANIFTPLSFPIKVDSLRQTLSSEGLDARIQKLIQQARKLVNLKHFDRLSVTSLILNSFYQYCQAELVEAFLIKNNENSKKI